MLSELVVAYLFLGGAGAGCCLVSSVLAILSDPKEVGSPLSYALCARSSQAWKRFFCALYITSLGVLLLGVICLMADLGKPEKVLLLVLYPSATYITFGAWSIILCVMFSSLCLVIWTGVLSISRRFLVIISIITSITSIAVVVYTGLLLSDIRSIPIWNTPWLVAIFTLSSISCGLALVFFASFISSSMTSFNSTLVRIAKVDAIVILFEAVVVAFCLFTIWNASGGIDGPTDNTTRAALDSLESILVGPLALLFWGGFVFVGLVVPFIQDVIIGRYFSASVRICESNAQTLFMLATAGCVLFGGVALRMLVIQAAIQPSAYLIS